MLIIKRPNVISSVVSIVLLAVVQTANALELRAKMNQDFSMRLYESLSTEVATREIALALSEMVLKEIYGDDKFNAQIPLSIKDNGDHWLIEGNPKEVDYPPTPGELAYGRLIIAIRKSNCEVIKLTQEAYASSDREQN